MDKLRVSQLDDNRASRGASVASRKGDVAEELATFRDTSWPQHSSGRERNSLSLETFDLSDWFPSRGKQSEITIT